MCMYYPRYIQLLMQMAYKLCINYETRVTYFEQALHFCTNMHTLKRLWCCVYIGVYPFSGAYKLYHMSTTMQNNDLGTGDLCDNIGLVGVFAKWSYMYVTSSPCHHDQAIPILSPLLFMHVDHPYIPLFKIRRIFDLLVYM